VQQTVHVVEDIVLRDRGADRLFSPERLDWGMDRAVRTQRRGHVLPMSAAACARAVGGALPLSRVD